MPDQPQGELVIQTIAMPRDTNASGVIFGGWLMSQMDLGSSILAAREAKSRVVTVARTTSWPGPSVSRWVILGISLREIQVRRDRGWWLMNEELWSQDCLIRRHLAV